MVGTLGLLAAHPLLSDRARLAIMAAICATNEPVDFTTLLNSLELTRGNLSSHLRKLEEAKLILCRKEFVDKKPRSSYTPTANGREELQKYLKVIENALKVLEKK